MARVRISSYHDHFLPVCCLPLHPATVFVPSLLGSPTPFQGISTSSSRVPVPGVDCWLWLNAVTPASSWVLASSQQCSSAEKPQLLLSQALFHCSITTIGVYANNKEWPPRSYIMPFISGLLRSSVQLLLLAGLAWLHTVDTLACGTGRIVWPIMTGFMKFLSYAGLAIVVIALIDPTAPVPCRNKDTYFMEVELQVQEIPC